MVSSNNSPSVCCVRLYLCWRKDWCTSDSNKEEREREILREIFHYKVNERKWMGMRECAPQNCRKLKLEEGSAAARDCGQKC